MGNPPSSMASSWKVKRVSDIGDLFVTHVMWMSFVIVLNKDDVKVRT